MSAGTALQRTTSYLSGRTPKMPRPRSSPHIPRSVALLAVAMQGKPLVPDVQRGFDAAYRALFAPQRRYNPVATLNRNFAAIKRGRSGTFAAMDAWLRLPETVELLSRLGLAWARQPWLTAIAQLQGGAKASEAFGTRPGRPVSWEFSQYERRAFKIEMERRQLQPAAAPSMNGNGSTNCTSANLTALAGQSSAHRPPGPSRPPASTASPGRNQCTEKALRQVLATSAPLNRRSVGVHGKHSTDDRDIRKALAIVRSIGADDDTLKKLSAG